MELSLPCVKCFQPCCKGAGVPFPTSGGDCAKLDSDGLCTIYDTRPEGCRAFNCADSRGFRNRYPQLETLLRAEGFGTMTAEEKRAELTVLGLTITALTAQRNELDKALTKAEKRAAELAEQLRT